MDQWTIGQMDQWSDGPMDNKPLGLYEKNKLAKLQATLVQNYELLADGGEV